MPRTRRRRRKRRRARRRRPTTRRMAKFAYNAVRGAEVKRIDHSLATSLNNHFDAATPLLLNGITQGSGSQGRIGNEIKVVRVSINIIFSINPNASFATGFARVILFRDPAPSNSLIALAGILQTTSTGALSMVSPYNAVPDSPYKVLRDRSFHATNQAGNTARSMSIDLKFPSGMITKYHLNANTTAAVVTNALGLYIFGDTSMAASETAYFAVTAFARIYFVDL